MKGRFLVEPVVKIKDYQKTSPGSSLNFLAAHDLANETIFQEAWITGWRIWVTLTLRMAHSVLWKFQ